MNYKAIILVALMGVSALHATPTVGQRVNNWMHNHKCMTACLSTVAVAIASAATARTLGKLQWNLLRYFLNSDSKIAHYGFELVSKLNPVAVTGGLLGLTWGLTR